MRRSSRRSSSPCGEAAGDAAFYGHPGVFVRPSHEAIARARAEGHQARMLPAVSAEDCLFADLGVDPATHGCASFDATTFLARPRPVDSSAGLVLWQVAAVRESRAVPAGEHGANMEVLVERLARRTRRSTRSSCMRPHRSR